MKFLLTLCPPFYGLLGQTIGRKRHAMLVPQSLGAISIGCEADANSQCEKSHSFAESVRFSALE
jgi:hypothetical protein